MNKNISRKNQLTEAQFGIISATGKISGEVKELLTCNNRDEMIESIERININLKDLISEIYTICDALNLDFNNIVGGVNGNRL